MLRAVNPGDPWLAGRRPFVRLLAEATARLGGVLELDGAYGHVGRFTPAGGGPARPIFGNALGLNADAAAALSADKSHTADRLAAAGLPVPAGLIVFSPAYAARMRLKNAAVAATLGGVDKVVHWAAQAGYPVIAKPNSGSEGRGVHLAGGPDDLRADLAELFTSDDRVRVEALVPGADVRVVVLDGAVRMAYRRAPPVVVGDGRTTVAALAQAALAEAAARARGPKLDLADPRIGRALAAQGLRLGDVPSDGAAVRLLSSANLSVGGGMDDLTETLPGDAADLALKAAAEIGLRLAGVDLRLGDGGAPVVLEVNSAPGLDGYASHGPAHWARAVDLVVEALSA